MRAPSGRDEDFRAFFAAEAEPLRRFATFLTGDPDAGADLAQEAMVRLYRHWGRVRNEDPGPYVRRIVVNLVRSRHRRRILERRHEAAMVSGDAPSHAGRVDDWVTLAGALATLPPIRRAVVVLRFWEDMTEPQIAELLDRPVGTIKSDLHRALAKLRPVLEGAGRSPSGP